MKEGFLGVGREVFIIFAIGMDPLVDIDSRLVFAIISGKVSKAINRKLVRNFREAGITLTPQEWNVLQYLTHRNNTSQQELCDATYADRPYMARLIDKMEEKGLVARTLNRFNRRCNIIRITDKGKSVRDASVRSALFTLRVALRGMSLSEIRTTQDVLRRVFDNVKASLGEKGDAESPQVYE